MGDFGGGRWVLCVVDIGGGCRRRASSPSWWWVLVVECSGGLWWCSLEVVAGRACSSDVVFFVLVGKGEV